MNILTFDIEEWFIEKKFHDGNHDNYILFDNYLYRILDLLDELNLKATFFCVGKLATDFPYVVRAISERGHEVGCHSNEHLWLTKMTAKQLKSETSEAINALQDVSNTPVISYRAPAFSIGENNKWAIDVLAECGIRRDASIFPAKRDFGGFDSFPANSPVIVEYNGSQLKEFPICLTKVMGKNVCYSGGGYFRFFPYWFIKYQLAKKQYGICYFHIGDLLHKTGGMMSREEYETYFKENGSLSNRIKRYVKTNIGTKNAFNKMSRLLNNFDFINIDHADQLINWNNVKHLKL